MKPDRIGVVLATYNRPDALKAALQGLARQTDRRFEVIVADDGSKPPTREVIEQLRPQFPVDLKHVWHADTGFRLAAIRNKGILAATADYLVFLDGDCVPQPDFIARQFQLAAPGRMVTGSRILLDESLTAELLATQRNLFDQGLMSLLKLRLRGRLNKLLPLFIKFPSGRFREVNQFTWRRIKGCNLAAWRDDVMRINGFDASFTGWGHEDADFVLRLFHAGVQRTDGAYATEVLHLWHREAVKDSASSNFARVQERMHTRIVRAQIGLDVAQGAGEGGTQEIRQ